MFRQDSALARPELPNVKQRTTSHFSIVRTATYLVAGLVVLSSCQTRSVDSVNPHSGGIQVIDPQTASHTDASNTLKQYDTYTESVLEQLDSLYAQAQHWVSTETGVDVSRIQMQVVSDEQISEEVAYETARLTNSQFTDPLFARQFLEAITESQHGTYAALFSTQQQKVLLSTTLLEGYINNLPNSANTRRNALLSLFVHELVHAADDQRYNIHDNRTLNFRASFAQSAVYEGHAQYRTRKICRQNGCSEGLVALDNFMFGSSNPPNQSTQAVQAISRNILEYSYVEGERFITALAEAPKGEQLLEQVLTEPPRDPIQILNPKSYPNDARASRNQSLISRATDVDHPWVQSPWISVESSPLKGVNLRADPTRRNAAIEGFTQLITAMVGIQLYDQSQWSMPPVEVIVLQADADDTAMLFGESLHENTQIIDTRSDHWLVNLPTSQAKEASVMSVFRTTEALIAERAFETLIGVSGNYVVQLTGHGMDTVLAQTYLQAVMFNLTEPTEKLALN